MSDRDNNPADMQPHQVLSSDRIHLSGPGGASSRTNPFMLLVRGRQPGRLGDILMKMGRLTLEQLQKGVDAQEVQPQKKLGEVLIEMGFVTPQAVQQALHQQQSAEGGAPALPPAPPRTVPRWKTDNQVRIWDRRLDK